MPIYEYECSKCKKRFDEFRKISDTSAVKCKLCGSEHVKKTVSAAAFQLKGGGWYKDGYASVAKPDTKPVAQKSEAKKPAAKSSSEAKK